MASLIELNSASASGGASSAAAGRAGARVDLAGVVGIALLQRVVERLVDQALALLEARDRAGFVDTAGLLELAEGRLHAVDGALQRDIGVEHEAEAHAVEGG